MTSSASACAHQVLDVVPQVMRSLRADMRRFRGPGLGVPQFRVLAFLGQNPGASLSDVADHVGLRLPSMSTLVSGLVERGLVARQESAQDRRRVTLELTPRGSTTLEQARSATLEQVSRRLEALAPRDLEALSRGLHALGAIFDPDASDAGP
jgi:DNA-binding MarR family transcriptional regulator